MVRYVGSPYHKRHVTRWGQPVALNDKSVCPDSVKEDEVVQIMEEEIPRSIDREWHSRLRDGAWPRYVWGKSVFDTSDGAQEIVWEARVLNMGIPEYKAYPVQKDRHADHMPFEVEEALWPD